VVLRDANGNPPADNKGQQIAPVITYDPVTRVVTLSAPEGSGPAWLNPNQLYRVGIGIPSSSTDDTSGIRAIDRATLDPASPSRNIEFTAGPPSGTPASVPTVDFCNDVLPLFQSKCSAAACHGAPVLGDARFGGPGGSASRPAASLLLETSQGVTNTVFVTDSGGNRVGRVANGANTGPLAGRGAPAGRVFGVDMPLVDPGKPANSWLLYKLLLAPPPDKVPPPSQRSKCDGTPGTPPIGHFEPAGFPTSLMDDGERGVLNNYVLGR
jgi:hypothetical protein